MSKGQEIIESLRIAADGDFARVTVGGKVWVPLQPDQAVYHRREIDNAYAAGFIEGFRAATGGVPAPYSPSQRERLSGSGADMINSMTAEQFDQDRTDEKALVGKSKSAISQE